MPDRLKLKSKLEKIVDKLDVNQLKLVIEYASKVRKE